MSQEYFQDYMPGNICFGCGSENPEGLQIKSYWEGETALCRWDPDPKYWGWTNLLNGGIMATLIDCHCMGTAMAAAYRAEGRGLGTAPEYRYATGTLQIKYLRPTPGDQPVELRARVLEQKDRKTTLVCEIWSDSVCTAQAEVVALRVFDASQPQENNPFAS